MTRERCVWVSSIASSMKLNAVSLLSSREGHCGRQAFQALDDQLFSAAAPRQRGKGPSSSLDNAKAHTNEARATLFIPHKLNDHDFRGGWQFDCWRRDSPKHCM